MATKLKLSRYRLAGCLRAASDSYADAVYRCSDSYPTLREDFMNSRQWCLDLAEQLESQDILGDVILLED